MLLSASQKLLIKGYAPYVEVFSIFFRKKLVSETLKKLGFFCTN